jgi:hypothetical protein
MEMTDIKQSIQCLIETLKEEEAGMNFDLLHKHQSHTEYSNMLHRLDMILAERMRLETALDVIAKYE